MPLSKITAWIIISVFLALIAWDIFVWVESGVDATISAHFWKWSVEWPIVPFISGVICGHLFWNRNESGRR